MNILSINLFKKTRKNIKVEKMDLLGAVLPCAMLLY